MSPPSKSYPLPACDPAIVRRLFSRPARVRDSQFLRREIASRMRDRLSLIKLSPQLIVDAGCGEGSDTLALQQEFAAATLLGVDGALPMLTVARDAQQAAGTALRRWLTQWQERLSPATLVRPLYINGDFGALPIAADSVDLIWSNLALHWHPRPEQVFAEWRRVLKTSGLLMFSCFGPDTFKELRAAFDQCGTAAGVMTFADMHDLGDMLVHTGFSTPVMDMETITLTYPSADRLLRDVRAFGGNPLAGRRRTLGGRFSHKCLCEALDGMRHADGLIHLSLEILYGHAFLPAPSMTSSGEAIIHFRPR